MKLEPENAERSAIETTVPGRMKGAITERSSSDAPLGFFLSVIYATILPRRAQRSVARIER